MRSEKTKVKEKNEQAMRNGEWTAIHYLLFTYNPAQACIFYNA
ncbi:hypothetical protein [Agriterribacter sp.]|nr:hypothetical protein [Agriterribacter sp.]HRP58020.1 hypothetical protein [Agriterribacter sp.]